MEQTPNTVAKYLQWRTSISRNRPAVKYKVNGSWNTLTWEEYYHRIQLIGLGLMNLGVKKEDCIAIFSNTRMEWAASDCAIMAIGAVTTSIYPTNTDEDIEYMLKLTETKIIFVESQSFLETICKIQKKLPNLKHIISFETLNANETRGITLEELKARGSRLNYNDFEKRIADGKPDDLITINFTSGTTGLPKGVMVSNEMFTVLYEGVYECFKSILGEDDTVLTWLPFSHIFGKFEHGLAFRFGWMAAYAEHVDKLIANISETKPTFMFGVPRIFEKIYSRVFSAVEGMPPAKKKIFNWALKLGMEIVEREQKNIKVPLHMKIERQIANKLVFDNIKNNRFGGRLKFFCSGSAPLAPEIAKFFLALGIKIVEGYGLTETAAPATVNRVDFNKVGTVGRLVPGVELKIAADGEILLKGPSVFKGYYKNKEATDEVFTEDGWFMTGDIGEFDQDGFLKITDRKKDLIKTAGGKMVAPQKIESFLKEYPMISQAVVVGDQRKFLTVLLSLNKEYIDEKKLHGPAVEKEAQKILNEVNSKLAHFETVKKFALLDRELTVNDGELTPSMKIKRKVVQQKYQKLIDQMYV